MSRKDDLENEIITWSRRLQLLKEKKAQLGISADPGIDLEIEDIEKRIKELNIALQQIPEEENQNRSIEPFEAILDRKHQELEQAREEYNSIKAQVLEKKKRADELREIYGKCVSTHDYYVKQRDNLNQVLRGQRKAIIELEQELQNARGELSELDEAAKQIRRQVTTARKSMNDMYLHFESARAEQSASEEFLENTEQKLRLLEADFRAAGGELSEDEISVNKRNNPWISGSFYLFAAVILMTLFAVISANLPWYSLVIVFLSGLLMIAIIGGLQLRNDESLSEENFLILMIETFSHMPLLRGSNSSKDNEPNAM